MKVSVCVLTFNHEAYLSQALDSIVGQLREGFELEVIIGDDVSEDRTLDIARDYASRFPYIKVLSAERKLGMEDNLRRVLSACDGDYVAFCDGDDFWSDMSKLKTQYGILSKDPGLGACYHNVQMIKDGVETKKVYPDDQGSLVDFKGLMSGQFMKTCALFMRNRPGIFAPILDGRMPADDTSLCFVALEDGTKGYYDSRVMAFYRVHDKGIWSMIQREKKLRWAESSLYKYILHYKEQFEVAPLAIQLRKTRRSLSILKFREFRVGEGLQWLLSSFKAIK